MGKQLENFITCGCESSAPFFVIYKAGYKPMVYWWQACMSYNNIDKITKIYTFKTSF